MDPSAENIVKKEDDKNEEPTFTCSHCSKLFAK